MMRVSDKDLITALTAQSYFDVSAGRSAHHVLRIQSRARSWLIYVPHQMSHVWDEVLVVHADVHQLCVDIARPCFRVATFLLVWHLGEPPLAVRVLPCMASHLAS